MKFSIKDFSSKCDPIRSFLRIGSHLLKKSLMENFIFCVVTWISYRSFGNLCEQIDLFNSIVQLKSYVIALLAFLHDNFPGHYTLYTILV